MIIGYKIIELDTAGNPKALFHGRKHPMGDYWQSAQVKWVRDGSGQKWYKSGFHILSSPKACRRYAKKFRKIENRYIAKVEIACLWDKPGTRQPVKLAKFMKLIRIVEPL